AHLPAEVAARMPVPESAGGDVTALRLEGFSPSVIERKRMLAALMQPFGEFATADEQASRALWTAIRDVTPFAADGASASSGRRQHRGSGSHPARMRALRVLHRDLSDLRAARR